MRPSPAPHLHIFLAASLVVTSSTFDFGGTNDVSQTAATVAPGQATDSLNPISGNNGFGNFGMPTQFKTGESTGGQGWPQQTGWPSGESTGTGNQGWPQQSPPSEGGQGGSPQMGWPSNPGGNQDGGALGVDCSGSSDGGWVPPSGDQGWWSPPSGGQGWIPPSGEQGGGTLGVDCSGSSDGGWAPPSGGQGWGTLGVDCSGSKEGEWPPNADQGWGTLGVECSNSNDGGKSPEMSFNAGGSNTAGGSQEAVWPSTAGSAPATSIASSGFGAQDWWQTSSTDASPTTETSQVSSNTADQGWSQPPATGSSSTSESSQESSNTRDKRWSQATQTSTTETSSSATTPTDSSVGADADQKLRVRSSNTATSSGSDANQEQQQQQQQGSSSGTTAGGDVIASMSVWGAPIVAETGTNHSSAVASFGKITSKSGGCVVGEPTEYISTQYLDWVWEHRIGPNADVSDKANGNVMANKNWIMDHLVHNKGSLNYCVRWDTDNTLSKDVASKFKGVLERHYNSWNKWLEGYNCWPFTEIKVNMVGWATKDASQFEWTDDSMGSIYEGVLDPTDGVPQCPNECYRYFDNVNNVWSDTSACQGEPFDVSFWLKEDIPYGFGYDWGQEVSLNDTMQNLYDENVLFIGHEIGHGFGLPDFYGLETKPSKDFPNSIMMAYSSTTITPSDGWMLRRVLDHVRDRYKF